MKTNKAVIMGKLSGFHYIIILRQYVKLYSVFVSLS